MVGDGLAVRESMTGQAYHRAGGRRCELPGEIGKAGILKLDVRAVDQEDLVDLTRIEPADTRANGLVFDQVTVLEIMRRRRRDDVGHRIGRGAVEHRAEGQVAWIGRDNSPQRDRRAIAVGRIADEAADCAIWNLDRLAGLQAVIVELDRSVQWIGDERIDQVAVAAVGVLDLVGRRRIDLDRIRYRRDRYARAGVNRWRIDIGEHRRVYVGVGGRAAEVDESAADALGNGIALGVVGGLHIDEAAGHNAAAARNIRADARRDDHLGIILLPAEEAAGHRLRGGTRRLRAGRLDGQVGRAWTAAVRDAAVEMRLGRPTRIGFRDARTKTRQPADTRAFGPGNGMVVGDGGDLHLAGRVDVALDHRFDGREHDGRGARDDRANTAAG